MSPNFKESVGYVAVILLLLALACFAIAWSPRCDDRAFTIGGSMLLAGCDDR